MADSVAVFYGAADWRVFRTGNVLCCTHHSIKFSENQRLGILSLPSFFLKNVVEYRYMGKRGAADELESDTRAADVQCTLYVGELYDDYSVPADVSDA